MFAILFLCSKKLFLCILNKTINMAELTTSLPSHINDGATSTILKAGLIAGLLDATAASIQYFIMTGNNPVRVFRYIASAVFGKSALEGGTGTALLGFLFHILIATSFAAFFFFIYPKIRFITRSKVLLGLLYGLAVWAVMNLIVVPLSFGKFTFVLYKAVMAALILMFCIGLPISLIVSKYYSRRGVE